jgi:hypothetical protein
VAGDWDNAGTFNAGTSTVQLVDGCGLASATISGDTTFANLDMTTTSGFLYSFTSGSTQTVTGAVIPPWAGSDASGRLPAHRLGSRILVCIYPRNPGPWCRTPAVSIRSPGAVMLARDLR